MTHIYDSGDRIRHRRRWYGVVIEDLGGVQVTVRFDDGTPPASVLRDDLQLASDIDTEVQRIIEQVGMLRRDPRFGTNEVATLNQSMEALRYSLSERALGARVAAEIDRIASEVRDEPFADDVAKAPRVRQWFGEGAMWTLQRMQEHANQLRKDRAETRVR